MTGSSLRTFMLRSNNYVIRGDGLRVLIGSATLTAIFQGATGITDPVIRLRLMTSDVTANLVTVISSSAGIEYEADDE
jgi:hypothetical protein